MHKLWITILVITYSVLDFSERPMKVYAGLSDPSSPRIRRGVLTSGNYRRATICVHDALLHSGEALSPLPALRGSGRTSRPSWVIILTQHTCSRIARTSVQPLSLHLSIHQPTNMITVTFILRVYDP